MKTTELFVEQTLTGFLVLTAAAAPFLSWETLQELPEEAQGGIDIGSAAGAIGVAYLLGVIFDRFADTLLARLNRWNRLLFAIQLAKDKQPLSPDDPFPEDKLQIEVIHQGDEAWEWMDYLRARIRLSRAMTAFVPALTVSFELALGFRGRTEVTLAVLGSVVAAYVAAFLVSQLLERSSVRLPKTYHLRTEEDCRGARARLNAFREPALWLGAFLLALALGLVPFASDESQTSLAAVAAAGAVLTAISGWAWWRMTLTFMEFLRDFQKWAQKK